MPNSRITPNYQYDENQWVISVLNTAGKDSGHSAIVVEGLERAGGSPHSLPFIGQYEITAAAEEGSGSINVVGIITRIKCFENEQNTRDYERERYPARSYYATPAAAKAMIAAIKKDQLLTEQAMKNSTRRVSGEALISGDDGQPIEALRYQKLGMDHPLVRLLGNPANGDNCAGWCLKKLAIAGIGDGHGKPKPYWQAGQWCNVM